MSFHVYPRKMPNLWKSASPPNNQNHPFFLIYFVVCRLFSIIGACLNVCDQWYSCFNGTPAHLETISHTIGIHRILNRNDGIFHLWIFRSGEAGDPFLSGAAFKGSRWISKAKKVPVRPVYHCFVLLWFFGCFFLFVSIFSYWGRLC